MVLRDYPALITLLIFISSLLVAAYFYLNNLRIEELSDQIRLQFENKGDDLSLLTSQLTDRQKEVFELIRSGHSNKEIMSKLFIEQSTLKTHINQIYRKLDIKNRKELKSISSGTSSNR
ncbi:MAG: hypothetical protein Kapaf2KO_09930 [Candidatus Kapaibacteriales bacterium]